MIKELGKYWKELVNPQRASELGLRWLRINVLPHKETGDFVDIEKLPVIYTQIATVNTASQPKQVVVTEDGKLALVSCMEGKRLQFFDLSSLSLATEIKFPEQCVEVAIRNNLAFVTTTNFARESPHHNRLWIVDIPRRKVISGIDTEGQWSKVIALTPNGNEALVSNWKSNSVSVIDVSDPLNPKLNQVIEIRKSPRGIAFTPEGNTAIVANFYSGNVAELKRGPNSWEISYISPPFDSPHYSGNLRHVLISPDGKQAYISNTGRNLVHVWSIPSRKFTDSFPVGKEPNTIGFANSLCSQLLISCRQSARICLLDLTTRKLVGVSKKTGNNPTGLSRISNTELLVTGFDSNTLERFILKPIGQML